MTHTIDPLSRTTINQYDDNGNATQITDPSNMKTKTEYDTLNRPKRVITDYTRKNLTATTVYNQVGNVLSTTDANGRITRNTYDSLHRLILVTMPDSTKTKYTYDANGNRKTVVDANNNTTSYTYDGLNRTVREQDSLGKRTDTTYDEFGNAIRRVQTDGVTSKQTDYFYDVIHRLKTTDYADATPDVTRTYDAAGNMSAIVDANTSHTFTHDALNRLTVDRDNLLGRELRYTDDSFDQRSNMDQFKDGVGIERTFANRYDNAGQLDTISTGTDVYNFDHNPDGTRQRLTRPNGAYTQYSYDTAKRLDSLNNRRPDTSIISGFGYQSDNVGNRTRLDVTNDGSLNHTVQYGYDSLDRLTGETRTGTNPYTLAWGYDAVGNRLSETRNGVSTTHTYNAGNELSQTNSPGPLVLSDDFAAPPLTDQWTVQSGTWSEANGELTASQSPSRSLLRSTAPSQTNFTASAMVKLGTNWQGLAFHIQNPYSYLLVEISQLSGGGCNPPCKVSAADSLSGGSPAAVTSASSQSATPVVTNATIGTTPVQAQIKIMRIANGGLSQLASTTVTGTRTWTKLGIYVTGNTVNVLVNNESKLVKSGLPFSNGTVGLTTEKSGRFDDFNLTDLASQATSSDERGNATVGDANAYDAENRLIHFVQGTMTVDYTYDAFGRRIKKHVNDNGTISEERYYYDGDDVLLDMDSAGNVTRSYVNGLGIDEKLTVEQGGSKAFFLTDALGSTRELIDPSSTVQTRLNYEAFGKANALVNNVPTRYQFTGREKDMEVPLMYYRARMYDPITGRFTGRDPVGVGGKSLYPYAENNPPVHIDPTGLDVYLVYRKFNDKLLSKGFLGARAFGIGHYYLAFDDKNVDEKEWAKLVNEIGGQKLPVDRTPNPAVEIFSFHPRQVLESKLGITHHENSIGGTFYTTSSFIGYNEQEDVEPFLRQRDPGTFKEAAAAKIYKLEATAEQQFELYRKVNGLRTRINMFEENPSGTYKVLTNNCGTWAVEMMESVNIPIPSGANMLNCFGSGVGGPQDLMPFTRIITGGAAAYGYTKMGITSAVDQLASAGRSAWESIGKPEFYFDVRPLPGPIFEPEKSGGGAVVVGGQWRF